MSPAPLLAPTPLEIAAGEWLGGSASAPLLPVEEDAKPRQALELALLPALERPPCLVSFSGGRDSSTLLAVAVDLARREQLPLPIPASLSFPAHPSLDERPWQEAVISHLALDDWLLQEVDDELELLGEESRQALRDHGLPPTPLMHVQAPLLRAASGGSLVTGFFANMLFERWRWQRVADVAAGRSRPTGRDALRMGLAALPRAARRRALVRREPASAPPWLRSAAREAFQRGRIGDAASEPARWDRRMAWCARRRGRSAVITGFAEVGAAVDARVLHPFADPGFLAALARAGGRTGFGGHSASMIALAGDLLPDAILTRSHRPSLAPVLWGERTQRFGRTWTGNGVDDSLVDGDALKAAWAAGDPRSVWLLQAAWLASTRSPARASSPSVRSRTSRRSCLGRTERELLQRP